MEHKITVEPDSEDRIWLYCSCGWSCHCGWAPLVQDLFNAQQQHEQETASGEDQS